MKEVTEESGDRVIEKARQTASGSLDLVALDRPITRSLDHPLF